jgi:hypothetical protein
LLGAKTKKQSKLKTTLKALAEISVETLLNKFHEN